MFTSAEELLAFVKEEGIETIDCRFCDLPGVMQHFTVPTGSFGPEVFTEGLSFDGSSIAGFQKIHESDMTLLPDPTSAFVDPFRKSRTLNINFFDIRFDSPPNASYYHIASEAGAWNSGRVQDDGNRGYKVKYKGGYFPVAPVDHFGDLRDDIVRHMENAGLVVERAHHECGTAGQAEINWRFDTMLKSADDVMKFKYLVKNTAWEAGKTATFMPKPIFGDNGSGMHVHSSLWNDGKPLFYDENGYAGLSDMARWYIGGILRHAPALLAFTNPSVNSFHRLVPGFEAPVNLVYSQRNRSACIRIPITGANPKAKRIEFRCPDPSSNPYLAFAAILLAGLDGIQNRIEPPTPIDKDLYELPPEEHAEVPTVPASLSAVLDALEADHEFLLAGDVFTPDLIDTWVGLKRTEIQAIAVRPHPHEFELYYAL